MKEVKKLEEPKIKTSQIGYGSPAQIWTELGLLAQEIFGSSKLWIDRFESLNITAVAAEDLPAAEGFEYPAAECVTYSDTTQHNTTQHNDAVILGSFCFWKGKSSKNGSA